MLNGLAFLHIDYVSAGDAEKWYKIGTITIANNLDNCRAMYNFEKKKFANYD